MHNYIRNIKEAIALLPINLRKPLYAILEERREMPKVFQRLENQLNAIAKAITVIDKQYK